MMKRNIAAIAALAALSLVCSRQVRGSLSWVYGSGTAQDVNRKSAISQASDAAAEQINAGCAGNVVTVDRTGTNCLGGHDGSPSTCLVFARGICDAHAGKGPHSR